MMPVQAELDGTAGFFRFEQVGHGTFAWAFPERRVLGVGEELLEKILGVGFLRWCTCTGLKIEAVQQIGQGGQGPA